MEQMCINFYVYRLKVHVPINLHMLTDIVQSLSQTLLCLGDDFPCGQLLTRSVTGKKHNIYLTSQLVKELLHRNELHVKVCLHVCTETVFFM